MTALPVVVLDTNVVFDCFLFRDLRCAALAEAIAARRLRWIATASMRDELQHVLGRGLGSDPRWNPAGVAQAMDDHAEWHPEPAGSRLVCSDADDQKFIDLALAHGAAWLLSRDRAVLKLARHARPHGVRIAAPADWNEKGAAEAAP